MESVAGEGGQAEKDLKTASSCCISGSEGPCLSDSCAIGSVPRGISAPPALPHLPGEAGGQGRPAVRTSCSLELPCASRQEGNRAESQSAALSCGCVREKEGPQRDGETM